MCLNLVTNLESRKCKKQKPGFSPLVLRKKKVQFIMSFISGGTFACIHNLLTNRTVYHNSCSPLLLLILSYTCFYLSCPFHANLFSTSPHKPNGNGVKKNKTRKAMDHCFSLAYGIHVVDHSPAFTQPFYFLSMPFLPVLPLKSFIPNIIRGIFMASYISPKRFRAPGFNETEY